MKDITDIQDPRLVKALAHPLRVRILAILENRTASPSEIAEELGLRLTNVSYHVRILAEYKLIKLVRRTPRRGAVEHHYKALGRMQISDSAWGDAPDVVKEAFVGAILAQASAYVNKAAAEGGFDAPEAHISRQPVILDAQGWRELSRDTLALMERARQIEKESALRLKGAGHEHELAAGLVVMLFQGSDFGSGHNGQEPARGRDARAAAKVAAST